MKVLQVVEDDHKKAERLMIGKLAREGHRLFNIRKPRRATKKEKEAGIRYFLNILDD
jgi:hypothetical protein